MPVRLIERTPDAYAYPLLIKQLLHTPLAIAPEQEITYLGGRRHSYRELRRLLDAENVRVRMDGMPRIEYTLDGEEQRLALPFLTADM